MIELTSAFEYTESLNVFLSILFSDMVSFLSTTWDVITTWLYVFTFFFTILEFKNVNSLNSLNPMKFNVVLFFWNLYKINHKNKFRHLGDAL